MARKTIEVGKVLRMANAFLASQNTTPEERDGVAVLLESILCETGNYQGFRYLESSDYPGALYDGSRRWYYPSHDIRADYDKTAEQDLVK